MRVGVQFLGVFALLVAVGMLLNSLLVDIDGAAGSHDVAMQEYATLQCLGDRLLSALPVDATVWVGSGIVLFLWDRERVVPEAPPTAGTREPSPSPRAGTIQLESPETPCSTPTTRKVKPLPVGLDQSSSARSVTSAPTSPEGPAEQPPQLGGLVLTA